MVHYTLIEENLIHVENPYALIKEIFDLSDCDIETTIDNFNSLYRWDGMFNQEDVVERLENGHRFFIFYQEDLVVGHCWVDPVSMSENNIYIYNIFVDKRYHDKSVSDSTVYLSILSSKLFSEGYVTIHSDIDDWHKKSQSFFEKLGFKLV
jgi:ribosomal protein S18 acetylase RimI-like enzyme